MEKLVFNTVSEKYPKLSKLYQNWLKTNLENTKRHMANREIDPVISRTLGHEYTGAKADNDKYLSLRTKEALKQYNSAVKELDRIGNAPKIHSVNVNARTYGRAFISGDTENGWYEQKGIANGGGYDRRGASISHALQKEPSVLKVFYDIAEKNASKFNKDNQGWHNILGSAFGNDRYPLPQIDGDINQLKTAFTNAGFNGFWGDDEFQVRYEPKTRTRTPRLTTTKLPSNKMLNQRAFK